MAYTLQFKPAALRQLEKLPRDVQRRVAAKLETLRDDPFAAGCKKLSGVPDAWRVRVGDYRIVYRAHRAVLLSLVLTMGHRREV